MSAAKNATVIPFARSVRPSPGVVRQPLADTPRRPVAPQLDRATQDLTDMEIPTFIRRQMD